MSDSIQYFMDFIVEVIQYFQTSAMNHVKIMEPLK